MNNIDDWLSSLLATPSSSSPSSPPSPAEQIEEAQPMPSEVVPYVDVSQQQESLSNDAFNEILEDNGFQEPAYEEAEEVVEDEEPEEEIEVLNLHYNHTTGTYNEGIEENGDLDAEENTDWNRLEQAGIITPVTDFNLHRSEETIQAVQDVNENYPAHSPDEEVSQDALDAFNIAESSSPASPEREPLIPPNSPTLLIDGSTSRFSGTEWYNEIQKARVILAGLGGIGSYVCYNLARMNIASLVMYDDDIVEPANMSGQLYSSQDIGKTKVDAMSSMISQYTSMRSVFAIREKFTEQCGAGDIMICGFDNMAARNTFFHSWRKHLRGLSDEQLSKCLFLDGRLSIDTLQVFCITGDNNWAISEYAEKYLFSDAQAEPTVCSLKQTTYLACMIGAVIVNLFTNFIAGTLNPVIPYDLPFFTEYDAQNMIFKTVK